MLTTLFIYSILIFCNNNYSITQATTPVDFRHLISMCSGSDQVSSDLYFLVKLYWPFVWISLNLRFMAFSVSSKYSALSALFIRQWTALRTVASSVTSSKLSSNLFLRCCFLLSLCISQPVWCNDKCIFKIFAAALDRFAFDSIWVIINVLKSLSKL